MWLSVYKGVIRVKISILAFAIHSPQVVQRFDTLLRGLNFLYIDLFVQLPHLKVIDDESRTMYRIMCLFN